MKFWIGLVSCCVLLLLEAALYSKTSCLDTVCLSSRFVLATESIWHVRSSQEKRIYQDSKGCHVPQKAWAHAENMCAVVCPACDRSRPAGHLCPYADCDLYSRFATFSH